MSLAADRPLVNPPNDSDGVAYGALRTYPRWLADYARRGRVSARAVLLWAEIASLTKYGSRGVCDASAGWLAEQLPPERGRPCNERTVRRYIAELEAVRALTVEARSGRPNVYVPHLEPLPENLPLFDGDRPRAEPRTPAPGDPGRNPGHRRPTKHRKHESEASVTVTPVGDRTSEEPPAVDDEVGRAIADGDTEGAMRLYEERLARISRVSVVDPPAPAAPRGTAKPAPAWATTLRRIAGEAKDVAPEALHAELARRLAEDPSCPSAAELDETLEKLGVGTDDRKTYTATALRRVATAWVVTRAQEDAREVRRWPNYLRASVPRAVEWIVGEMARLVDERLDIDQKRRTAS